MKEEIAVAEREHSLSIENRARAIITGVTDVGLFNEQKIVAATSQGSLTLTGQGLHVESLNLEEGRLIATGKIVSTEYDGYAPKSRAGKKSIFK